MSAKIPLGPELERLVVSAVIHGLAPLEVVKEEELSKEGRLVWRGIQHLARRTMPPYALGSVFAASTDLAGGDPEAVRSYLKRLKPIRAGRETADLLRAVRDKQRIIALIEAASEQLGSGKLDPSALSVMLTTTDRAEDLVPLAKRAESGLPDLPSGPAIKSLPKLSDATGGVFGFWAVGGGPGVGKSTLALQIAVSIQRHMPVLFYDFEQGESAVLSHLAIAVDRDPERIRQATAQLYIRESLRTLASDLHAVPPPALIILDSLQKAPVSAEFRREGLEKWVYRLESLKRRGYAVLAISEVGRTSYNGVPQLNAYKETGSIEYSADIGIQLAPGGSGNRIEAHVVKNRHRPHLGLIVELERAKGWWFRECGEDVQDRDVEEEEVD